MVFGHTPAVFVHEAEVVQCLGLTLLGSLAIPAHRFGIVLRNAPPIGVHSREVVLRSGMALPSGQPVPLRGLGSIAFRTHAQAVGEHDLTDGVDGAKGELGINVTLLGAAANFGDPVRILPEPPRRD